MVTVDGNRAEFSFFRAKAHSVHLIGEFNGWQEGALSMTSDRGYWRAGIRLPVGEYRFHYVADGAVSVNRHRRTCLPGPQSAWPRRESLSLDAWNLKRNTQRIGIGATGAGCIQSQGLTNSFLVHPDSA
jgi:hypothetical protein